MATFNFVSDAASRQLESKKMAMFTKTVLRPLERDLAAFEQPYMVSLEQLDSMDVQDGNEEETNKAGGEANEVAIPTREEKEITKAKPLVVSKVGKLPSSPRAKTGERQGQLIKLVLRLASIAGYNEDGRMRLKDGSFSDNLNLVPFLSLAMRKGRNVKGLEDFVFLLREAKVTPDMVVNEYLKQMLEEKTIENQSNTVEAAPTERVTEVISSNPLPMETLETIDPPEPQVRGIKRKRNDHDDDDSIPDRSHVKRQKLMTKKLKKQRNLLPIRKSKRKIKRKTWITLSSDDDTNV